jgi:hypothetical protein
MKKILTACLVWSALTLWPLNRALAQSDETETIFTPTNPSGLQPIASHETPAYSAAKYFQRGANLGSYLESGRWGVKVDASEFAAMKREGFDHVRGHAGQVEHRGQSPRWRCRRGALGAEQTRGASLSPRRLTHAYRLSHRGQWPIRSALADGR